MSVERVFLGLGEGLLRRAAGWLVERYGVGAGLSGAAVVVPGARAGRTLVAALAEEAAERGVGGGAGGVMRPRVLTPGSMAEAFGAFEGLAVADALTADWSRARAVRALSEAERRRVLGAAEPGAEDAAGWLAIGRRLGEVVSELAGGGVRVEAVAAAAEELGGDAARYAALAAAERGHVARLAAWGRVDREAALLDAVAAGRLRWPGGDVVLVGLGDQRAIDRAVLEGVARGGSRIVSLVFADEAEAGAFDTWGGLVTRAWAGRAMGIGDGQVVRVRAASDQGAAVASAINDAAGAGAVGTSADVTVAMGDEALGDAVARALELTSAGKVTGRAAAGVAWGQTSVGVLWGAIAAYAEGRSFEALGRLLRHPEAAGAVHGEACAAVGDEAAARVLGGGGAGAWVGLVRRCVEQTLARAWPPGGVLGAEDRAALKAVHDAVTARLPSAGEAAERRPIGGWAEAMHGALTGLMSVDEAGEASGRSNEAERVRREAVDEALGLLDALAEGEGAAQPGVTFGEAMRVVGEMLGGVLVAEVPRAGAVEMIGWLELAWDDAPAAVVTDVVEGALPRGGVGDAWLPDRLRGALGLADARRRLARDAWLMWTVLGSRRFVRLVVPMAGDDGEPRTPSRLLMQGLEGRALARRVKRLFDDREPPAAVPALVRGGGASGFLIPRPVEAWPADRALRVSDFRLYLADPFRFYVTRLLGLGAVEGALPSEVGAMPFGNVLHDTLSVLGDEELAGCADAGRLEEVLLAELRRRVGEAYGGEPAAVVRAQTEAMAARLGAFAQRQAALAAEGWAVVAVEAPVRWAVGVEREGGGAVEVTIKGRIDRVDVHVDGRVRLIDYKTGDTAKSPSQTHRDGDGNWVDLQLPLYAEAAARGAWADERGVRVPAVGGVGEVELGYVLLPRDAGEGGWRAGGNRKWPWDEGALVEALGARDRVLREVLGGGEVFWPTELPRAAEDAVAALAGVDAADRAALLAASGWAGGGDG